MDKQLSKLIWLYGGNNENKFFMPINIINAHTQRVNTYKNIEGVSEEDIRIESYAYLDYVKNALSEEFIQSTNVFGDLLKFVTDTHKVVGVELSDSSLKEILENEIKSLTSIRKALKKTPNRAGFRIKLVDKEKDEVSKRLSSLDNDLEKQQ